MSDRAVQEVAIEKIICRKQVRGVFDEDELTGLAQSIKEQGVLQPLLAHREGSSFVLDDGERRLRAARRVGLSTVPVIVDPRELNAAAVLQRQLVANCQRQDLSAMEKATSIEALMAQTGWCQAEVALKLGLSPGNVSRLLALLDLPEFIQDQVASGAVSASAAYQLSRVGDSATQSRLASEVENGLSRDELAAKVRSPGRRKGSGGSKRQARYVARLGGGRTITFSGAALDSVESLIEWVEQLLVKARKVRSGPQTLDTFLRMLRDEAGGAA